MFLPYLLGLSTAKLGLVGYTQMTINPFRYEHSNILCNVSAEMGTTVLIDVHEYIMLSHLQSKVVQLLEFSVSIPILQWNVLHVHIMSSSTVHVFATNLWPPINDVVAT